MKVLLLSGGLDSAVALLSDPSAYDLAMSFDYGQPRAGKLEPPELTAAKQIAARAGVKHEIAHIRFPSQLSAGLLGGSVDTAEASVVPGRNACFVSLCAMRGASTVALGCNADDQSAYIDCRAGVLGAVGVACGVQIELPLLAFNKAEIRNMAKRLGIASSDTMTCYRGIRCGECSSCRALNA